MPRLAYRRSHGYLSIGASAIEYPAPAPPPPPKKRALARRAHTRFGNRTLTTMSSYVLGDDASAASAMPTEEWQAQMLAQSKAQSSWMERWVKRDEMQRWIQIAATLSIPLAAAVWKMLARALQKNAE